MEIHGKLQELQNEVNCMNDSKDFQDNESPAVEIHTLPVHLDHSLDILHFKKC